MVKYVTAGGMRIDYLITHTGEAQTELVGGNALYTAVGAAIWGEQIGLWSRIGENYPQTWLEALPDNILIDGLIRVPGWQDHRTFFAYTPDGRREDTNPAQHFARIGKPLPEALQGYVHSTPGQDEPDVYEPLALRPSDWPAAYDGATAVHLSPLSLATHRHVPPHLRQRGIRQITVDPGERYMIPKHTDYIRQLMPQLDAFLPSAQEIRTLFGAEMDLAQAARQLGEWGTPVVAVKNGAEGVLLWERKNGRLTHLPAYHREGDGRIVDVTGAGDSFCGGFMVGLARTGNPLQAAQMGLVSASLVIEGYGALYALRRQRDAAKRLNRAD
ncbi:MAG TPA: carbohydrate kinase family protein [Anaerolineae bacterium]|nr:carbohydrate kinase family protein [Anaerolineae bacterium]